MRQCICPNGNINNCSNADEMTVQKSIRQLLQIVALGCGFSYNAIASAGTEFYTYDARGRLASVTYPNGTSINYTYDAAGNRISSGASVATAVFTVPTSSGLSTTFQNPNGFAVTPSSSGITGSPSFVAITSNTCSGSIAAGATCTINFTAATPDCKNDNYSEHAYVTNSAGTAIGAVVTRTTTKMVCN